MEAQVHLTTEVVGETTIAGVEYRDHSRHHGHEAFGGCTGRTCLSVAAVLAEAEVSQSERRDAKVRTSSECSLFKTSIAAISRFDSSTLPSQSLDLLVTTLMTSSTSAISRI
jgi:hypothetical protein